MLIDMKNPFWKAVFLACLCLSCQSRCTIDIGQDINSKCVAQKGSISILKSSGSIEKGFKFEHDGILYQGIEKKGLFTFIYTNDLNFKTPDGVSVSSIFKDFKANPKDVKTRVGWAKTYKLSSGWICGFDFKSEINDKSKVMFLFKE